MIIPGTIKIGGHSVKISQVKMIKNGDRIAEVRTSQNVIRVADFYIDDGPKIKVPESMKAEALLHEIIHYVLLQAGYPESEKLTCVLASGLFQVLRDNALSFEK